MIEKQSESLWVDIPFKEITIGDVIGGGGAALVYRGIYNRQNVALKTLFDPRVSDELRQEFMDELLVISGLRHKNIVTLIGACVKGPHFYMVMELCDFSLYQQLHQSTAILTPQTTFKFAKDIASGMLFLHTRQPSVIHRDLKSANVLIHNDGTAKLCDFGLVRTKVTTAGTPSYMPPELLCGGLYSKAVDVYMYGILLWELYTRDIPFRGLTTLDIKNKVLQGDRFRIPTLNCPEICQELMVQCWDGDPQKRPDFATIISAFNNVVVPQELAVQHFNVCPMGDALDELIGK